jgi:arylsulfatase A-like enzyme
MVLRHIAPSGFRTTSPRAAGRSFAHAATRPIGALLALLLAACGSQVQPPEGAALAGQDCLLIVLDALHADHLGCYGGTRGASPTIDALAARGVRFAQARSNASWTLPSTATLFTGLYQATHGLQFDKQIEAVRLSESADTLAELFARAGYDTLYAGQNPLAGAPYGLDQGFAQYESFRIWTDDMIRFLEQRLAEPRERPLFTYVHLRRPHTPYDALPEHMVRFADPEYDGPVVGSDDDVWRHNTSDHRLRDADLQHLQDRYLANIHQADAWLARLLSSVDESRTLIVLTSDHGEAVGQHGTLGHNWHTWGEYLRIPLVLVHPSLPPGSTVDAPVSTVDIMPTLLDLFGLPRPGQELQGRSLARALTGQVAWPHDPIFASSRALNGRRETCVVDGRWKYTFIEPTGEERLFDLVEDKAETRNLVDTHPREAARLRQELIDWRAPQRPSYTRPSDGLDDETLEQLQALGYVR